MSRFEASYGGLQCGKSQALAKEFSSRCAEAIESAVIDAVNERLGYGWSAASLGGRLKRISHISETDAEEWFLDGESLLVAEYVRAGSMIGFRITGGLKA